MIARGRDRTDTPQRRRSPPAPDRKPDPCAWAVRSAPCGRNHLHAVCKPVRADRLDCGPPFRSAPLGRTTSMNLPILVLPSRRLSAGGGSRQSQRDRRRFCWRSIVTPLPLVFAIMTGDLSAQTQPANTTDLLKALSLEELGNLVVTSVSRRPEELSTVASAIQVITQDDIRRSGAT